MTRLEKLLVDIEDKLQDEEHAHAASWILRDYLAERNDFMAEQVVEATKRGGTPAVRMQVAASKFDNTELDETPSEELSPEFLNFFGGNPIEEFDNIIAGLHGRNGGK